MEERYIRNAAVLPDLRPPPPVTTSPSQSISTAAAAAAAAAAQDEPLRISGPHAVEDYQAIYHSVVDPMLKAKSGNARPYHLRAGPRHQGGSVGEAVSPHPGGDRGRGWPMALHRVLQHPHSKVLRSTD